MAFKNSPVAEATAAVAAALIALLASYPIDVIKTNIQTRKKVMKDDEENVEKHEESSMAKLAQFKAMFRGLHLKCTQCVVQTFAYFYVYSRVRSTHRRITHSNKQKKTAYQPSIPAQLSLAAATAAITMMFCLPLESIATKSQMKTEDNSDDKSTTTAMTCKSRISEISTEEIDEKEKAKFLV